MNPEGTAGSAGLTAGSGLTSGARLQLAVKTAANRPTLQQTVTFVFMRGSHLAEFRRDGKDGQAGQRDDLFGRAAQEKSAQSSGTGRHDNEVEATLFGVLDDPVGGADGLGHLS